MSQNIVHSSLIDISHSMDTKSLGFIKSLFQVFFFYLIEKIIKVLGLNMKLK